MTERYHDILEDLKQCCKCGYYPKLVITDGPFRLDFRQTHEGGGIMMVKCPRCGYVWPVDAADKPAKPERPPARVIREGHDKEEHPNGLR